MPVRGAIIAFIAAGLNGGSARKKARPDLRRTGFI